MKPRQVRPHHYLAYGLTDVLGAGSMAVVAGWILFFYTTFCGLTAVQAAAIFAVSRLIDAVWSPLVGHVSDHIGSTWLGRKFGKRRVFLLMAVPLMPSFAVLWVSGHSFWYYFGTYVFFELVYASVLVPYNALAPEMTQDYKQRSYFSGVRMICAQASAILAGILPKWIIDTIGGKDSPQTFFYMGIIFTALFMVVLLVTYFFSWEREADPTAHAVKKGSFLDGLVNLFRNIGSTLRIRAFRLHLGMYLGGYICQDIYNAAFTYFVAFVLGGSVMMAAELMGAMYLAQLVAVAAFIPLILWLQPAPSFRLASLLYAVAIIGLGLIYQFKPANTMMLLYVPVLIAGLGRGGLNFIPWNIYNYIADVDEVVTGERREGVFSGVMIFTRKTAMAIAVMAVGLILDAGGLVKGATSQSIFTQHVITIVLVVGPLLLLVFGILVSLRFKLDKRTHAVLMAAIARFKGGERAPEGASEKAIVENLTGFSYETLWGNNTVVGAKK